MGFCLKICVVKVVRVSITNSKDALSCGVDTLLTQIKYLSCTERYLAAINIDIFGHNLHASSLSTYRNVSGSYIYLDENKEKKRPGMAHLKKKYFGIWRFCQSTRSSRFKLVSAV